MLRLLCVFKLRAVAEGVYSIFPRDRQVIVCGTSGTESGCCYLAWMRHLVKVDKHLDSVFPAIVVELGPGDSLGIDLASLLSGVGRHIAVDTVERAHLASRLRREQLALQFREMPEDDLTTAGAYVVARKPAGSEERAAPFSSKIDREAR